ncbi:hypothetical protein [Lyngbya aestuarii]|uniref:hypothetical protein n=1 Tax=Lyngbya aestuarii TaxID=118322 RepID=UPI00403D6BAA
MKIKTLVPAMAAVITSLSTNLAAYGQTVNARCDVYPIGEDSASAVVPCTFSQRQGAVHIERQDGVSYSLSPKGSEPGNYTDQYGKPAYRQSGLGELGQIYRLADESVYVYWDTSGLNSSSNKPNSSSNSNNSNPTTYTTVSDPDHINIQISEGEFIFRGTLTKLPGPDYAGSDGRVRVVLTPNTGRITVFNEATGQTFYDYYINPVFVGEDPNTMCNPALEAC